MTINQFCGLADSRHHYSNPETLAKDLLDHLQANKAIENQDIYLDKYVHEDFKKAFREACAANNCQLKIQDSALYLPKDNTALFVVAYPNCEGNVEDYSDFIDDLHRKNIPVAMICDALALQLLKSPESMGADFAFQDARDALGLDKKTAARVHGMTAYLNDALEVYDYAQENNAFFNTLKIQLPDSISDEDFKALAADYELDYLPVDDHFILISIQAEDDHESLGAIIECLAQAGDNFGTEVDEEDWENICALDDSLLA